MIQRTAEAGTPRSRRGARRAATRWLALAALGALSFAAACKPLEFEEPFDAPEPTPVAEEGLLGIGDVLDVEYCRSQVPGETYKLGVGDRIEIQVYQYPDLTVELIVAPDGSIAFYGLGAVSVQGRTLEELRVQLEEALRPLVAEPQVTVFLIEADARTERFVEMMLRNPNGASREIRINLDGRISLPGIGSVEVAHRTMLETEQMLNERLQAVFPSLQVVVNARNLKSNIFSVVGEVMKPGIYSLDSEVTLIEALAVAGGETEYGNLDQVVVITRERDGSLSARVYPVEEALLHGNSLPMIKLRPRDTVIVMRKGVGNANEAIDHYIRRNLPFNLGVGVTYRLDDE